VLRQFYRVLLEPIERQLQTEHLILIPHGPLHHVPFAALLDGQNEALQRAAGPHLTYAPSATILLRRRSRSRESLKPCLAIGYNGPADGRMLRHTETEATFVAGLTEGEAWVGAGAKRTQLKAKVAGQRWLHFACHGRFNYEQPLESYLEVGQDERLTAVEILQDWQLAAELVTLSACQTGISRVLRGDESMGLIRAFLYAGAKAVLVTQWPVEDLPTFLLMQRFYGALQSGFGDPAAALHQAQLWLRQLSRANVEAILASLPQADLPDDTWESLEDRPADQPLFAHPRYWAAFILVGQTVG
jgi:CHAT domain-containing protein